MLSVLAVIIMFINLPTIQWGNSEQNDWPTILATISPFMEQIVPLLQTAAWVTLIGFSVAKFGTEIQSIVRAIGTRIRDGADLEVGGVKLLGAMKPATDDEKESKLDQEVAEAGLDVSSQEYFKENASETSPKDTTSVGIESKEPADIVSAKTSLNGDMPGRTSRSYFPPPSREKYRKAEELALNYLEQVCGKIFVRDVTLSGVGTFDAVEIDDRSFHIYEIMLMNGGVIAPSIAMRIRQRCDRILASFFGSDFKNIKLTIIVVYEGTMEAEKITKILRSTELKHENFKLDFIAYSTLEKTFNNPD